jgi:hypothetical protein
MKAIYAFICCLVLLLVSCGQTKSVKSHSQMDILHKGISFDEAKDLIYNNYDPDVAKTEFIRVRGEKHRYIQYSFCNKVSKMGESTTYYYDYYFIVFDGEDKLLFMGYPYEYKRHPDSYIVDLGNELSALITRYSDD